MPRVVTLIPTGGTANAVTSTFATPVLGQVLQFTIPITNVATTLPTVPPICPEGIQVVGLVPLTDCDKQDCRITSQNECYLNPVFGKIIHGLLNNTTVSEPSYENDFNTFLADYPIPTTTNTSIYWRLQKADNQFYNGKQWQWNDIAILNDNTYGIFYGLGSIGGFPTYTGYVVNWGEVVLNFGNGIYRIVLETITITSQAVTIFGSTIFFPVPQVTMCKASEPFLAREFDCKLAAGTFKVETWLTGNIGSKTENLKVFNLCNIEWYDSVRAYGFFGMEEGKYEEVILEFQTGQLDTVRKKLTNGYQLFINYSPKWLHDRFKTYALMADTTLISDYNYNNSDYDIKRKGVLNAGSYKPTYLDNKNFDYKTRYKQRTSKVTVEFRENVESIIKNVCCTPCVS